jgi:NAD(P)H-flavin reductase
MALTLPIIELLPATPRASIVRLGLGGRVFPYHAGQSVLVSAPGEVSRRAYSLTEAPAEANARGCLELLIGTDRNGRTGIPLHRGGLVDVEGPVGRFVFPANPPERRFVFIGGGTGIAPLRAMLRQALVFPESEIHVLYSARTPDDFAYAEELRQLSVSGRISLYCTATRIDDGSGWTGGRGRLSDDTLRSIVASGAVQCFVCGPQSMVHDAQRLLETAGVSRERVVVEEWCRLQPDENVPAARFPMIDRARPTASVSR